jgi:hypothetical protein
MHKNCYHHQHHNYHHLRHHRHHQYHTNITIIIYIIIIIITTTIIIIITLIIIHIIITLTIMFMIGQSWQFKGWKYDSPITLFSQVLGVHLATDGKIVDPLVQSWNCKILKVGWYIHSNKVILFVLFPCLLLPLYI